MVDLIVPMWDKEDLNVLNKAWVQSSQGFSGQLFHIFEIKLFCLVVVMSDLVHDVEAIHGQC